MFYPYNANLYTYLAVLPTAYRKSLTYQLLPNMSASLFRGGRPGSHNCCPAVIGHDGRPAFGFVKGETRLVLCYSNFSARLGQKGKQKLEVWRLGWGWYSCRMYKHLFAHPEALVRNQGLHRETAAQNLNQTFKFNSPSRVTGSKVPFIVFRWSLIKSACIFLNPELSKTTLVYLWHREWNHNCKSVLIRLSTM